MFARIILISLASLALLMCGGQTEQTAPAPASPPVLSEPADEASAPPSRQPAPPTRGETPASPEPEPVAEETSDSPPESLADEESFAQWWEPVAFDAQPSVPGHALPLADANLNAAGPVMATPPRWLTGEVRGRLAAQGFAVADIGARDDVVAFYEMVSNQGWPVFVTSDSLLHLYHIQFGETLRAIEEEVFAEDLAALCRALKQRMMLAGQDLEGRAGDAAQLAADHLHVAECLATGQSADGAVGEELALIDAHEGFAASPLFGYREDYSQYVPRGHYTRSETLERYFRAMMWLGRTTFLIKSDEEGDALVNVEDARLQTAAALLMAERLRMTTLPDGRSAQEVWDRIYTVTAFHVGFSDDLTPGEYREIADSMAEEWPESLNDNAALDAARELLAALRAPAIYGGTGGVVADSAGGAELLAALDASQGMRLMGQRLVPDAEAMGRLVFPTVGLMKGAPEGEFPFTAVESDMGVVRGFPRALDVMSVLGSARAAEILEAEGDTDYEGYDEALATLRSEFAEVSEAGWNRNLYWAWLHALQAMFGPWGEGYPTFMQSQAWHDRALETAQASWSALRHDTILYAKQSHTIGTTSMRPPQPRRVVGYVEPVPALYARLLATARMTRRGLDSFGLLDRSAAGRLAVTERLLARLLDISVRELHGEELSEDDYEFIRTFAEQLEGAVAEVDSDGLQTTIIADVHTDGNTGMVLEEGSGYLRALAVAYLNPDGDLIVGVGPALSHHEFKQPMSDRLTDEAWREMLQSGR